MIAVLDNVPLAAYWTVAAVLLLLQLTLSVALVASSTLSRVALHRLAGESHGRLAFLAELRDPYSTYRAAAALLRQLSLVGAMALLVLGARAAGWSIPALVGGGLAALLGALLVDTMLARWLAPWGPRIALKATAPLVRLARTGLYPVIAPVQRVAEMIGRHPQNGEDRSEEEQEEEVEALIEVGEREGLLEAEEGAMMRGIVDLDETRVREIMTPRIDIVALPGETTVAQARRKLLEAGHTRMPVYRETIDNVVGVLHARDLVRAWEDGNEQGSIEGYLRDVIHVPEQLSAADLLSEIRLKTKMVIVVDEFGGVSGLVTLEDLLEEIVGEIRDEHEQEEEDLIQRDADGSYVVHATAHVGELEDRFGVEFDERDFDTVGGLVISAFGRVPTAGESVETQGLSIEVLEAGPRRILRVRIKGPELAGQNGEDA